MSQYCPLFFTSLCACFAVGGPTRVGIKEKFVPREILSFVSFSFLIKGAHIDFFFLYDDY